MKLNTLLFGLISVSAGFAQNTLEENLRKCEMEFHEYEGCLQPVTTYTSEKVCPIIHSEKCQKFYNDPLSLVPDCKNDYYANLLHPIVLNYAKDVSILACQKDEAGNPCPFSEFYLDEYKSAMATEEEKNKAKENTCKSNLCRKVTYDVCANIQVVKEYFDQKIALGRIRENEAAKMEEIAQYLDSNECKAMSGSVGQGNATGNAAATPNINNANATATANPNAGVNGNGAEEIKTNAASTIKAFTGIFITMSLFLLSLY